MGKAQPHGERRVRARKRDSVKSLPGAEGGNSEVVLYEAPGGEVRLDVRLDRDTVWLTQAQMADLFGRERSVVAKHLRNAFAGSWRRIQYVQILHILQPTEKPIRLSTTTSTSLSRDERRT